MVTIFKMDTNEVVAEYKELVSTFEMVGGCGSNYKLQLLHGDTYEIVISDKNGNDETCLAQCETLEEAKKVFAEKVTDLLDLL